MTAMIVEIKNLEYSYGGARKVLQGINLVFDHPGLYCIIGPNGVGKSTLVKCINGISKPTSGDVLLDGTSVRSMKLREISKRIGYVPASTGDCFSMPVLEAIMIGRYNHQKMKTSRRDVEMVHRAMDLLGLEELADRGFNELSAGQHQKVALARGLVTEAEMLILDEPTSNLDIRHQIYVTELLRAIAEEQDKIILMICHDLNIAARYAHHVIVMEPPGVIHSQGTPKETITESMLQEVYGVDCKVLLDGDIPFMKLGFALPEDRIPRSASRRFIGPNDHMGHPL